MDEESDDDEKGVQISFSRGHKVLLKTRILG